jgi:hypothetical protein
MATPPHPPAGDVVVVVVTTAGVLATAVVVALCRGALGRADSPVDDDVLPEAIGVGGATATDAAVVSAAMVARVEGAGRVVGAAAGRSDVAVHAAKTLARTNPAIHVIRGTHV